MYQMDEVSDSSNTSGASAGSMIGARLAPPVQLRRPSQQDAASGSDLFDDRILTLASADAGHVQPIQSISNTNNNVSTTVLQAATPGATEPHMAGDAMPSLGAGSDLTMTGTTTDSSASHLGDPLQSNAVAAPNFDDTSASQQAPTSTSLADHSIAANDVSQSPAPGPWSDAGSGAHRNGALSPGLSDNAASVDAGSAGVLDPSHQTNRQASLTLDVLPLDNIVDPAQHHHAPANDDAQTAQGSGRRSDSILNSSPIPNSTTSGHADVRHANAADPDPTSALAHIAHADVLKVDGAPEPANDAGQVSADHNKAASSGTLASDGAAIDQTQASPPSSGALVEAGAKAILLATDESPSRIGPHASAADFVSGTAPNQVHSTAQTNAAFSPAVLGARDQLASAIATATPDAAAITTMPPPQVAGAALPTLGADMHALQKHAA
jgi:hypothetical protein